MRLSGRQQQVRRGDVRRFVVGSFAPDSGDRSRMDDRIDMLHRVLNDLRVMDRALDAFDSRIGQCPVRTASKSSDSVALLDQLLADGRPEETSVAGNKDALGQDRIARCVGV